MGEVVRKTNCPKCGSVDNLAIYADGGYHCFTPSCTHSKGGKEGHTQAPQVTTGGNGIPLLQGNLQAVPKRFLTEETCKKFGYAVTLHKGQGLHIAPYYKDGKLVAQHTRSPDKDFGWRGNSKEVELFGQHLWRDAGKMVIVTEGEIDCMTVSQLQGNKWPVVSISSGASSGKKDIQRNLEWLERFESVILMFDMDDAGSIAVGECAPLFTPGKCKIARLPFKDANECMKQGKGAAVIDAIWGAKTFRPDGIVSGVDTWDVISMADTMAAAHYPWEDIDEFLNGLRRGELVTVTAGAGIGKSLVVREIAKALMSAGEKVGYVALEENLKRTIQGFMGMELNRPIHISREGITDEQLKKAWAATAGSGNLFLYDHWGSTDSDNLVSRLRYLARGCGCGWLVLDHLSIVVSGIGDGDERRLIDNTMTKLRTLVEETGVGLLLVSHLKRPEGNRGHEDGLITSLSHLRGSAAIAQLSDIVLGIERNQQDGKDSNKSTVRVLKNRFSGRTGIAGVLDYSADTGRLVSGDTATLFKSRPRTGSGNPVAVNPDF